MKNKMFLSMLCAVGLCLSVACSAGSDTTTVPALENLDTDVFEDLGIRIDEKEQQFFRNQSRSLSILDEAMKPFRKESGGRTSEESEPYCESFAGVFIDDDGNLNIGIVQGAITERTESSINRLRGQVIYRQDVYSYNFLARKLAVISEMMNDFGIHTAAIRQGKNRLYIYLTDINYAGGYKGFFI